MKRFIFAISSLIFSAAALGGVTAFAEEETLYPADGDFIKPFTALADYAVGGENYACAEGNKVYVFNGGEYSFDKAITGLDCNEGVFYCSDGENVYSLPDKEICDYVMPQATDSVDAGKYNYKLIDNTLKVADWSGDEVFTLDGEYSNLKKYDGKVFAQSGSAVYELDGSAAKELELYFTDYSATEKISVGGTADKLKNYTSVKFVNIKQNSYMTSLDLTSLEGDYFALTDNTDVTRNTVKVKEDTCALLLCYTGNAAIVAIGDNSYILLSSAVEETTVNCYTEAEFDSATVTGNRIYASPYVIIGTSAVANASGTIVNITRKLVCEGVLGSAFYEVQYQTEDGTIKTGFVADGFLTEYIIEDNKPPEEVEDPDYSEESNMKTVLIVLAVVILVLAAVGYLAYIGTADARKKKEKSTEKPDDKPAEQKE